MVGLAGVCVGIGVLLRYVRPLYSFRRMLRYNSEENT